MIIIQAWINSEKAGAFPKALGEQWHLKRKCWQIARILWEAEEGSVGIFVSNHTREGRLLTRGINNISPGLRDFCQEPQYTQ